jgi:hypothetical protein
MLALSLEFGRPIVVRRGGDVLTLRRDPSGAGFLASGPAAFALDGVPLGPSERAVAMPRDRVLLVEHGDSAMTVKKNAPAGKGQHRYCFAAPPSWRIDVARPQRSSA